MMIMYNSDFSREILMDSVTIHLNQILEGVCINLSYEHILKGTCINNQTVIFVTEKKNNNCHAFKQSLNRYKLTQI